ncbi:bifunctional transcriptional activator/DNA repair enzyme AdaA [Paenibacillus ginsengarvi]|uniref:bifunctional transcriptional activator/DNA repair enzyme AdaA n=1 Tax=Paenibacillus ginsengarvi TaxID=400777 RepID=UPI003B82CE07
MLANPERGFTERKDEEAAPIPEELWEAIVRCDASYDDRFIYAVRTTGIFCKPSCKSREPNRANVRIFSNARQALDAEFRPCKRCKPTGERLPDQEWVAQIKLCIEANYAETLTLHVLADMCHGSPYHLHRTFKRITGQTPVEYVQRTRVAKAAELLLRTNRTVADIALAVGVPNPAYFTTLFRTVTGQTPGDYRKANNETIEEVLPSGSEI